MYLPSKSMWLVTLVSGMSVTQNAFMLYVADYYAQLEANGGITCANPTCSLGGTWGTVLFAFSLLTIVLWLTVFYYVLMKWRTVDSGTHNHTKSLLTLLILTCGFNVATSSYNFFNVVDFGKEMGSGNFGSTCKPGLGNCNFWSGNNGNAIRGLNASSISLTAVAMMQYFLMAG